MEAMKRMGIILIGMFTGALFAHFLMELAGIPGAPEGVALFRLLMLSMGAIGAGAMTDGYYKDSK